MLFDYDAYQMFSLYTPKYYSEYVLSLKIGTWIPVYKSNVHCAACSARLNKTRNVIIQARFRRFNIQVERLGHLSDLITIGICLIRTHIKRIKNWLKENHSSRDQKKNYSTLLFNIRIQNVIVELHITNKT